MSVRVVATVPCEACGGWRAVSGRTCPECHGKGTVERECRCDGCRHYRFATSEVGRCIVLDHHVADDFACKAWEPRE